MRLWIAVGPGPGGCTTGDLHRVHGELLEVDHIMGLGREEETFGRLSMALNTHCFT